MRIVLALILAAPVAAFTAESWPGLPPDCWSETRMVHSVQDLGNLWQKNIRISARQAEKPASGRLSANKGYTFVVEGSPPSARITIYAETDHVVDIDFSELFGLSDVRWISEKLIFMRPWWGRIAGTDLIFDVEREKFIYSEAVLDATIARQQYLESCPLHGCQCIKNTHDPALKRVR